MKVPSAILGCVLCVVLFAACTLSKYPIDETPGVKIDPAFLGKWKAQKTNEKDATQFYTLTQGNEYQYKVLAREAGNKKKEHYTAYLSEVGGDRFLNVYSNDDTEKRYLFLKLLDMNPAGNKLKACSVDDSTMQYLTSAAQVRERITANLNRPDFYRDTVYFLKVK